MANTGLIYRIGNKLGIYLFKLRGIDRITRTKISPRRDLKEIGSKYGGWVIPTSLFDKNSICYCVGCGEDITFDLGLIDQYNCQVYGFDPTPRAIQHVKEVATNNAKYHFEAVGLWDKDDTLKFYTPKNENNVSHSLVNLQKTEDYIEVKVRRLKDIMKKNEHNQLDLLKLDIEGAEYNVIQSIIEDKLDIKVICVEYDECFNALDDDYINRINTSVNSLLSFGYSLICAQGNGNYTFLKHTIK